MATGKESHIFIRLKDLHTRTNAGVKTVKEMSQEHFHFLPSSRYFFLLSISMAYVIFFLPTLKSQTKINNRLQHMIAAHHTEVSLHNI